MTATADGPDFTGATTLNGGTVDATITNSEVTVTPASGSTFEITGPVEIPGNPQVTTGWRGTLTDGSFGVDAESLADIYGSSTDPADISGFGALFIVASMNIGVGCEVSVNYMEGSGSVWSTIGAPHVIVLEENAQHVVIVPSPADRVWISAFNPNSTEVELEVLVTPLNESVNAVTYPVSDNFISELAASVPASTTNSYFLPSVQPGPATFAFHARGSFSSFNVEIFARDDTGTNAVLVLPVQVGLKDQIFQITLPARTIVLTVSNTSASAAGTFDASLIPGGVT